MGVARAVPDGIATFADGAMRFGIVVRQNATIGRMRFTVDAPLYSFTIARNKSFVVGGFGVSNQSTNSPRIRVLGGAELRLTGTARLVGPQSSPAARITTTDDGGLIFVDSARGGNGVVINSARGVTSFDDNSSAEQMDITNQNGGWTIFAGRSTGETASIFNSAGGDLDCVHAFGPQNDRRLPMGDVVNRGRVLLGRVNLALIRGYTQSSEGTLNINVISNTIFGVLTTGQGVRLAGAFIVNAGAGVQAGTYKVIRATGARTGKFASVQLNGAPTLKARLAYSGKEVSLILEPK